MAAGCSYLKGRGEGGNWAALCVNREAVEEEGTGKPHQTRRWAGGSDVKHKTENGGKAEPLLWSRGAALRRPRRLQGADTESAAAEAWPGLRGCIQPAQGSR